MTAGCVKYDTTISIDEKGNVKIFDTVEFTDYGFNMFESRIDEFVQKINNDQHHDESAEKYLENDLGIVKITQNVPNIAKNDIHTENLLILKNFNSRNDNGKFIKVKNFFFFSVYDINGTINRINFPIGNEYLNPEYFHPQLTIKIPTKAKKSNANSEDDINHIYNWKINNSADNSIILSYYIVHPANIIIFIIALIFFIICIIAFILHKKNEINKDRKLCPFCGQRIKKEAKKCRYCKNWL